MNKCNYYEILYLLITLNELMKKWLIYKTIYQLKQIKYCKMTIKIIKYKYTNSKKNKNPKSLNILLSLVQLNIFFNLFPHFSVLCATVIDGG